MITQDFRTDPSTKWYDFKSHSSGLKYEYAMSIRKPKIIWRNGPFPASFHDITIFRGGKSDEPKESWKRDSLYFKMEEFVPGKKAIGDSAYEGEPEKVFVAKEGQSKDLREFMARVKQREETLHSRLQSFNVLMNHFRHGKSPEERMKLHDECTGAVTLTVQYDFDTGRPPFEVR